LISRSVKIRRGWSFELDPRSTIDGDRVGSAADIARQQNLAPFPRRWLLSLLFLYKSGEAVRHTRDRSQPRSLKARKTVPRSVSLLTTGSMLPFVVTNQPRPRPYVRARWLTRMTFPSHEGCHNRSSWHHRSLYMRVTRHALTCQVGATSPGRHRCYISGVAGRTVCHATSRGREGSGRGRMGARPPTCHQPRQSILSCPTSATAATVPRGNPRPLQRSLLSASRALPWDWQSHRCAWRTSRVRRTPAMALGLERAIPERGVGSGDTSSRAVCDLPLGPPHSLRSGG